MPKASSHRRISKRNLLAQVRVEIAERLVQQEDLGLDDQGARDPDPPLLAAGQLAGIARFVARELYDPQHLPHAAVALAAPHAAHAEAVRDVLRHGHVRPQQMSAIGTREPGQAVC